MTRLASVVTLFSALAVAAPEVKIDCPAGTEFVKDKGCVAKIAAAPECPGGTRFDGSKCVALVDTSCPAGMHFVPGTGCVPGKAAAVAAKAPAPAKAAPAPAPAPAEPEKDGKKKREGTFDSGFRDRLKATCGGHAFEVHAGSKLIGGAVMLLADGTKFGDEVEIGVGQTKNIAGKLGARAVDLKIEQGLWGTRYTLKVDGTECKLGK